MFTMMVDVAQVLGRLIHPRHHIGVLREDLDLAGENSETNRGLLNKHRLQQPQDRNQQNPTQTGGKRLFGIPAGTVFHWKSHTESQSGLHHNHHKYSNSSMFWYFLGIRLCLKQFLTEQSLFLPCPSLLHLAHLGVSLDLDWCWIKAAGDNLSILGIYRDLMGSIGYAKRFCGKPMGFPRQFFTLLVGLLHLCQFTGWDRLTNSSWQSKLTHL